MTNQDAIKILESYNQWRRGADIPQPNPKKIGEAIDIAVRELSRLNALEANTNDATYETNGNVTSKNGNAIKTTGNVTNTSIQAKQPAIVPTKQ